MAEWSVRCFGSAISPSEMRHTGVNVTDASARHWADPGPCAGGSCAMPASGSGRWTRSAPSPAAVRPLSGQRPPN